MLNLVGVGHSGMVVISSGLALCGIPVIVKSSCVVRSPSVYLVQHLVTIVICRG